MKQLKIILLLLCTVIIWSSCKKDDILRDSSARLSFSTDTILFDTVFVTFGSTTRILKVYNNNDQDVEVSSIVLAGGSNSKYRINVNGVNGTNFTNVKIRAKDSIFIFVEVTIDPNNSSTPFIVADSIVFNLNGNVQMVDLVAFGQNAHFIRPDVFPTNGFPDYSVVCSVNMDTTWGPNIPHVVFGYAVVDSACTLTILPGTQIYFYNKSGLWVFKDGKLIVNGSITDPVVFQGTRLESAYQEEPGQWDRIWINEGAESTINYAIIKNAFIGLQPEVLFDENATTKKVTVTNTIIRNMSGFGIFARNFEIEASNTVVANCGSYCAALTRGGDYNFDHCTFANYWRFGQRSTPALYLNNYGVTSDNTLIPEDLTAANFNNSIVYGSNDNEIELDFENGALSEFRFDHVLMKIDPGTNTSDMSRYVNIIKNRDPGFVDSFINDYRLDTLSNAKDAGDPANLTPATFTDILGVDRMMFGNPDLGAYERQD